MSKGIRIFFWVIATVLVLSAISIFVDGYATAGACQMLGVSLFWLFAWAVIIGVSFLPYFISLNRSAKNALGIFLLCLFTAWTFFGWVGALVWSVVAEPAKKVAAKKSK